MLQQFLRTASDGWELALASARNLFAEADLHADEVGGDFAGEAHRLGVAVSEVHELLRGAVRHRAVRRRRHRGGDAAPSRGGRRASYPSSPTHTRALEAGVLARRATPKVRPSGSTATCTSARRCAPPWAGSSSTSRASRPSRWPSAGCPTPPGATSPACSAPSTTPPSRSSRTSTPPRSPGSQISYRAKEWLQRNRDRLPRGLRRAPRRAGRRPALTPAEEAMIDAYEADKAVYEVIYEARNRPAGWTSRCRQSTGSEQHQ